MSTADSDTPPDGNKSAACVSTVSSKTCCFGWVQIMSPSS